MPHRPLSSSGRHAARTVPLRPPARRALPLLCALALGLAGGGAVAQAQAAASIPARVPAGPLADALSRFALQAGVALVMDARQLQGLHSAGLSGPVSAEQGFARLLQGSGLQARRTEAGYVLEPIPAPASEADTPTLLPTVRAKARSEAGAVTEGTGRYGATGPSSSATGLSLSLRETPQSLSVITRERMDDFRLETLAEVLEQTPGLSVTRQGNAIDFRARGNPLNLQTDGVRQISSGWYYLTSTQYSLDDMAEIDRVEVLKGSSGLVNGAGYPGGTINRIRKRPTREFQASVSAGLSSWNNLRVDADLSGPLSEDRRLRGRVVAAAAEGESFRDHERRNSQLLYGTMEADLGSDTLLSVGLSLRRRELQGMGSTQPIQAYTERGEFLGWTPRGFNVGARWAGYEQRSINLFARLEQQLGRGWLARLQLGHETMESPEMRVGYLLGHDQAAFNRWTDIHSRNQNLSLALSGPLALFGRQHELLAGLEFTRFRAGALRGDGSRATLADLGLDYAQGGAELPCPDDQAWAYNAESWVRRQRSLYAAGRFSLSDSLKLIAGLRSTDYRQHDTTASWWNYHLVENGVTTPYAGLVWDLNRQLSLYASYASIFQAQSAQDEQGRTLPPEDGRTYELGAKAELLDGRLHLALSHFWMKTDHTAEETGGQTPGGDAAYRAVSGATRRGYELELSGELARGWQAQGSYVMNSSNLESARNTPKHQFKLGLSHRIAQGRLRGLTLGAATRWQSAISVASDKALLEQRAYWLVDLMARYPLNDRLSLSAQLNNLFDQRYLAGVTDFRALHYTWGAPRSFGLSLRALF